ncbi:hypothetical protein BT96DRAFT_938773 [Gymnopus androsaceus JB14]|uniref:Uncharacterized protein n=1 Tax=Gymnopus androsaceus JB14 TaxID=1447944 RepID=A0A6A4HQC5_9AGAR|nr:hypothetical protein BT96DRAFT_938773 [Gymnopus androsaceus JB14]
MQMLGVTNPFKRAKAQDRKESKVMQTLVKGRIELSRWNRMLYYTSRVRVFYHHSGKLQNGPLFEEADGSQSHSENFGPFLSILAQKSPNLENLALGLSFFPSTWSTRRGFVDFAKEVKHDFHPCSSSILVFHFLKPVCFWQKSASATRVLQSLQMHFSDSPDFPSLLHYFNPICPADSYLQLAHQVFYKSLFAMYLSDERVESIALAWPKLTQLTIMGHVWSMTPHSWSSDPQKATINSLSHFAKNCRKLEYLAFPVLVEQSPLPGNLQPEHMHIHCAPSSALFPAA